MTFLQRFADKIERTRPVDKEIGEPGNLYLRRWHVIPRNPIFNIYLHQFLRSDDDRALHDHPWMFNLSILIQGPYIEHTPKGIFVRNTGDWYFRWGRAIHRVELTKTEVALPTDPRDGEYEAQHTAYRQAWTLFITGPVVREWGFHCPKGWVHWKIFTQQKEGVSAVGPGCGD